MSAFRSAALLMALVIMLPACSSEDQEPTPSVNGTASPVASPSPSGFASERHGYHLEVPAEWNVAEYGGTWTDLEQFSAGAEVPGEDVVSAPDRNAFLVSNSMAIPDGMSTDEWLAELERLVETGSRPGCKVSTGTDVVAGEPARFREERCADMHIVGRSLTRADRGYYFTIGYPSGDVATAATLEGVVASIGFE